MSLSFDPIILAEGAVPDGRGALTLVGLGQNVVLPTDFPAKRRYVVFLSASGIDTVEPGSKLTVDVQVKDTEGTVIATVRDIGEIGGAKFPDLPARLQIARDVEVVFEHEGEYQVTCSLTVGDERVEAAVPIYVRPSERLPVDS